MYIYNTLTNTWDIMQIKSDISPSGIEGACMLVDDDDIYIFGGNSEFKANNYLWKFVIAT